MCKKNPSYSDIERLLRYSKRRRAATKRKQNANKKCSVPGVAAKSKAVNSELNVSTEKASDSCELTYWIKHPFYYYRGALSV